MENVINETRNERKRQNEKFGEQNHSPIEWISILNEETGEAAKEALEHHFDYDSKKIPYPDGTGNEVLKTYFNQIDELRNQRMINYRTEMIQVAAVAIQAVESLDRQTKFIYAPDPEPKPKTIWFFDCWDRTGTMETKEVRAINEENATMIFKYKFPEFAFDHPY